MQKALVMAIVLSLAGAACSKKAAIPTVDLKTDDQKTLYALGLVMSDNLATFNLTESDLDYVKAGLTDGALKHTRQVDMAVYGPKRRAPAPARASARAAGEKGAGSEFLSKAALEKGAVKTATGFVYLEISPGKGATPTQ